ncbi:S66 peptidase family protein [Dyadobacter sandarakinus]|uniref:LD-carboxypeptidase n=1 Tax=Dyadobacter sandarakinus TaxID=2747268 RepID=A0ABX7ICD3_9BACT|nr:LD-carboxypeptidase [Dyadobacter sandarakinus]QRR03767.1 LD-carboxypeptidase [Dyadobacter sandarakinus]
MSEIKFPPFLQPGDRVGIVAPASAVQYDDLIPGIELLRSWGLEVVEGATLKSHFHQFSATDEARQQELQDMLDDPSIHAIMAARGGYGCSRIVDKLDFTHFQKHPKWIVGFSDLTVLLSHIYNLGYAGIHGPMAKSITAFGSSLAAESVGQMLFGELPAYAVSAHPLNRFGTATAEVVGGNLCILAHLLGSGTEVDTKGKILFIEDIHEYLYNLDRMMIQLKRAGKLEQLAGLIVGQFTDMKDNSDPDFGKSTYEIVHEHVSQYSYPVCFDFPVGHVGDNRAMGIGMTADFTVGERVAELTFLTSSSTII